MAKKRVYVSSTFVDLEQHRKAVKTALERAQFDVECMEKYPAFDERPVDKCLADVAQCDCYVLILALRYGFQPPADNPQKRSITQMEYEEAVRLNKPCLAFLLDQKHPWPPPFIDTNALKPRSKIGAFRKQVVSAHGIRLFTSPESLASAVQEGLRNLELRGPERAGDKWAEVRAAYLAWLRRTCESVELLGLDLKETQNLRLGQVYVPAVTPPKAAEREKASRRLVGRYGEERPDLLLHRLGDESLYVPGAPGAGKSTFCRWLALAVASGALPAHPVATPEGFEEQLPDSLRGRFPVLWRLREWAGQTACLAGNGQWTRAQLEDGLACWLAATRPGGLTPEVFREELGQGRCLLILDGVDEVPETIAAHLPRRNLLTGLADALPDWLKAGNRVLLTSRPYGLDDGDRRRLGLPVAELAELPRPLQDTFIRRWYAAADPPRAGEKAAGLAAHLNERRDLDELRGNPMLLTALCVKFDEGQRLPKDFYRLYDSVVGQVLYKRYLTENERDRARLRLGAVALGMHRGDTTRPRLTPEAEVGIDEVDRLLAELAQTDWTSEGGSTDAASRREDLLSNSGLLLPRAGRRAAFYHLSFQEFFAAVRLRRAGDGVAKVLSNHAATPAWRRTLTFLFCAIADQDSAEAAVQAYAPLLETLAPDRLDADANPALLLADCLEVAHARGWNLARFAAPMRGACHHALAHLAPPQRAHLWRTLGRLDWDDRPGVGARDGLPEIDWVEVPGGKFKYGDPPKSMSLPAFHVARYPVTNAQYQCFIDDRGYEDDAWWHELPRPAPAQPSWTDSNHPRETVSWFEAVAFCRWLSARLAFEVRLPTEEEWEKAARGTDGREFPWGQWQPGFANIDETEEWDQAGPNYLGLMTSAVGIYPQGASPSGALDLAGNVWEWCLNNFESPNDTSIGGDARRVVRGGSWINSRGSARCASRFDLGPGYRGRNVGFRLVCVSPIR